MAAFSDQFDRVNPLQFVPVGHLRIVLTEMVDDAREFLAPGRTVATCKSECQSIELQMAERIDAGKYQNALARGEFLTLQDIFAQNSPPFSAFTRDGVNDWEHFAMVALWKIIDIIDLFSVWSPRARSISADAWVEVNANLAVAYKALQLSAVTLAALNTHSDVMVLFNGRATCMCPLPPFEVTCFAAAPARSAHPPPEGPMPFACWPLTPLKKPSAVTWAHRWVWPISPKCDGVPSGPPRLARQNLPRVTDIAMVKAICTGG
jgi:hypothetical protein